MFGIPTRRRAKAAGSPILPNVARDGLGRNPAPARWREYAAQAGWWAAAAVARGLSVLATECAILLQERNESGRAQTFRGTEGFLARACSRSGVAALAWLGNSVLLLCLAAAAAGHCVPLYDVRGDSWNRGRRAADQTRSLGPAGSFHAAGRSRALFKRV
jgi:hypothetical protein